MAHWRTVAQCMRQHGVSGFPNPTTAVPPDLRISGEVSDRDGAILAIPATINMQSAAFTQAAAPAGSWPTADAAQSPRTTPRRTQVRQELLIQSGIALAGMSLLSLGLGWLMAGRVLQPLEDSYEAQRQFVANASHELRAPLTRQRALIEVALADSDASVASLRTAHERVLASEQHLEQLIDGLLALTRGQAGLERRERLDLAALTSQAMLARESQLAGLDLDVRATLDPAATAGDPRLVERLIANLIDNAIRHNAPGGRIEITTGTRDRHRVPVDREHRPAHPARGDPASLPALPTSGRRPYPPHQRTRTGTLDRPSDRHTRTRPRLNRAPATGGRTHHRSLIPAGDRRQLPADPRHLLDETQNPASQAPRLTSPRRGSEASRYARSRSRTMPHTRTYSSP